MKNESEGVRKTRIGVGNLEEQLQSIAFSHRLMYEQLQFNTQSIVERLNEIVQPMVSLQEQMQQYVRPIEDIFKVQQETFDQMREAAKQLAKNYDNFCLILTEYGWPPPLLLNVDHMRILLRKHDECTTEEFHEVLNQFLLKLYNNKRLGIMLDVWSNCSGLVKRINIIKEAIECHIEGKYSAAIPTLLPQLEGMLVDANITEQTEWLNQKMVKLFFLDTAEGEGKLSELVRGYISGVLYQSFHHGKDVHTELNRNAILHGGDVGYGTQVKSLKAILLFDYFFHRIFK